MKNRFCCLLFLAILLLMRGSYPVLAQPAERYVKVWVMPDRADWQYKIGEKPKFKVMVTRSNTLIAGVKIKYEIMPDKMDVIETKSIVLPDGQTTIELPSMKTAGFLRCKVYAEVEGKEYMNMATAGFAPTEIKPTNQLPQDFDAFWDKAKADLAKVPIDANMTLSPDRCTPNVNVYHVSFANISGRMYGILCIPKKEGKYPALLQVPGAGARPYSGDIANAEKGLITLQIGIHGIPVILDNSVYVQMMQSAVNGYWTYNLDDRDKYYYKRVYMGCVRAVDFLFSLPQFDGVNIGITGGSQGGMLSIVTASLDSRIKWLAAYYPAFCDVTGYLEGRAGGWPHLFVKSSLSENLKKVETTRYYDVVNFARNLKVAGFYSWGFNDEVCPPTSMYAAYNLISAPKQLLLAHDTGHWTYPEQVEQATNWLIKQMTEK